MTTSNHLTLEYLTESILCEGSELTPPPKGAPDEAVRKYITDVRQKIKWMQRNLYLSPAGAPKTIELEKRLSDELSKLKSFITDRGYNSEAEAMGYTPPTDAELSAQVLAKAKELGIGQTPDATKTSDESDGTLPPDLEDEGPVGA